MRNQAMSYRSALIFAFGISALVHLLFLIMFLYGRDAVVPQEGPNAHPHPPFSYVRLGAGFLNMFIMTFLLYILNFSILKSNLRSDIKLIVVITGTIAATCILSWISSVIQMTIFGAGPYSEKMIRGGMVRDMFIAIVVSFSSQVVYLSYRRQQMVLENKTLIAENVRTRYEALKNQVDPHFLFNSLNTLNSIIAVDPVRAQDYVQQLSQVFRYTLQNKEIIPLKEELEFTKAYCSLMKIRYGDSLDFRFQIDEKYYDYSIVPLSVQTLVENAIKHNVISNRRPLIINVISNENDTLSVRNVLQPKKEAESGEGIGLANLAERYRLLWKKEIEISEVDNVFVVTIPLVNPRNESFFN